MIEGTALSMPATLRRRISKLYTFPGFWSFWYAQNVGSDSNGDPGFNPMEGIRMANIKPLIDGLAFAEGPRWHNGKLWFSDMQGLTVMNVDLNGRTETVAEVPNWPSGLGWLPDGRLLIVSMTDRKLLRLDPDGIKMHADISKLASFHCNDMVVDGKGNAYVGNLGYDVIAHAAPKGAEVVLVKPDGSARVAATGLQCPNGSVVTAGGKILLG